MDHPPSSNDINSFKQWPEEVLKVYGQLPLPSVYDFVLANEKIASELRRQGKDLHKMVAAILSLRDKVSGLDNNLQSGLVGLTSEELTELQEPAPGIPDLSASEDSEDAAPTTDGYYPAWEVDMMRQANKLEERQWEEIYIAMLEVILQTFEENESTYGKAAEVLQESDLANPIKLAIKELLQRHNDKIQSIRDQMFAHLKDINLEPITPRSGELYNEDIHRVIDTVPAAKGSHHKRNTIARVIRIGYKRHGALVRQADVCVYES